MRSIFHFDSFRRNVIRVVIMNEFLDKRKRFFVDVDKCSNYLWSFEWHLINERNHNNKRQFNHAFNSIVTESTDNFNTSNRSLCQISTHRFNDEENRSIWFVCFSFVHRTSTINYLFVAREGDAKQSYLFLRNELPVRLASMMKEMAHLPPRLLDTPSVKTVNGWYGTSLHELHSFKDSQPSTETVKK